MLSAFSAESLLELKPRDKSRIECMVPHADKILVGLNTGVLRIYQYIQPPSCQQIASDARERVSTVTGAKIELLREIEKFTKGKIEQLVILEDTKRLFVVANNQVHLHDTLEYKFIETLPNSKGATVLAPFKATSSTGYSTNVSRLAVAIKRRLQVWTWFNGSRDAEPTEFTLSTGIKSVTWTCEDKLVVGGHSSYSLINIALKTMADIIGPGSIGGDPSQEGGRFSASGVSSMGYLGLAGPKPLAARINAGEILLAKDINTLFLDENGSSLQRRQIPWSVAPESIGFCNPYILATQTGKGTLEVRNPRSQTVLQILSIPLGSQLYIPSYPADSSNVFATSERAIWRLTRLPFDDQVDILTKSARYDEAISLLSLLGDNSIQARSSRLQEVKIRKAQSLFDDEKYRDAIDLFLEVNVEPERVIGLYPPFIAGSYSRHSKSGQSELGSPRSMLSILGSSPRKRRDRTGSIDSSGSTTKLTKQAMSSDGEKILEKSKPLEGQALKIATEELRGFLVSVRTRMKRVLSPDGLLRQNVTTDQLGALIPALSGNLSPTEKQTRLKEIAVLVDTTLFRAYMFVSPSFAGPLFRLDNFCDPEVVKEKLLEAGRYDDLLDFLHGKKLHREALTLMKQFGKRRDNDIAAHFVGPEKTIAYLQTLPSDLDGLIIEFVEWPLHEDPDLAMGIFLADTENAETLPRDKVLALLQKTDPTLAVCYLEHIIDELNDTTPDFHQQLGSAYIKGLLDDNFPNEQTRAQYTEKALRFLDQSKYYQAHKLLMQLGRDDVHIYEARAIVLRQMGQHKKALNIYVFWLDDTVKAEEYCNKVYMYENTSDSSVAAQPSRKDQEEQTPSIYAMLLSLYLQPPSTEKVRLTAALEILTKHGSRMSASSTIPLIPEVLPVRTLESYFQGHIRCATTLTNESRLVAGLRNVIANQAEEDLKLGNSRLGGTKGRNRRVLIDEDRACGVCHKRFGGSAIKVLTDNSVVHYGCSAL